MTLLEVLKNHALFSVACASIVYAVDILLWVGGEANTMYRKCNKKWIPPVLSLAFCLVPLVNAILVLGAFQGLLQHATEKEKEN